MEVIGRGWGIDLYWVSLRRGMCPFWGDEGRFGGSCSIHLPSPDHLSDRLQCLNLSIVSNATCRAAFPGRITDNMVCAGGIAGEDACQVSDCRQHSGQKVGEGELERWGRGRR